MILGGFLALVSILIISTTSESQEIPSLCCVAKDGVNYVVNSTFITTDCMSKCVCTADAHLACIPSCPSLPEKCPIGYKREEVNVLSGLVDSRTIFPYLGSKGKDKKCYCKKVVCKPLSNKTESKQDYCQEGKKLYKPGEVFNRGCSKLCRCQKNRQIFCVPFCPSERNCSLDFSGKSAKIPVEFNQAKCQCKVKACKPLPVKDECDVNGKTYKSGDKFIATSCSGSCQCLPGGQIFCKVLCLPLGPAPGCERDEDAVQIQNKVANSNCTCPAWQCAKREGPPVLVGKVNVTTKNPSKDQCEVGGRVYHPGDKFPSADCSQSCMCMPSKTVSCPEVLCMPDHVTCKKGEIKEQYSETFPNSSCSCTKYRCKKT